MKFTIEQIKEMLHAAGYDVRKKGDRNFFNTGIDSPEWEELVKNGVAVKLKKFDTVYYAVTSKGLDLLKQLI